MSSTCGCTGWIGVGEDRDDSGTVRHREDGVGASTLGWQAGPVCSGLLGSTAGTPIDLPHGSPPYTVAAHDGEWLGIVDAPLGLQTLDVAHGHVLGVQKDETRRESVVVYELIER